MPITLLVKARLLVLPMLIFMMALSLRAVGASLAQGDEETPFVVVLDPGHGGKDHGAIGAITNEKSINLAVAKAVRDILGDKAPEIKVVMTRSTDRFVTLNGRADMANKAGGDLFVSIHTNSVANSNPNRKTVAGASVYTLGLGRTDENLAVAMRENAVMTLEPDYTTAYQGFDPNSAESYIIFEMDRDLHMEQSISAAHEVQKSLVATAGRNDRGVLQAGFLVLRATSMPAILVELDFICNPTQERYMASSEGQQTLGEAVAQGIMNYSEAALRARAHISGKPSKPSKKKAAKPTTAKSQPVAQSSSPSKVAGGPTPLEEASDSTIYRIQFLASQSLLTKGDSRLNSLPLSPVNYYLHGGMVKYTLGRFSTEREAQEALPAVRRRFKDAFVISTKGNSRL
ncbi:MAG: N-acetylmuramoyl-L-alanine amidase [Pseudoflavonifractor sp.]|nr:N-acetylmuramoyl-L-alanine amidase [Alloprevotella sp.]MCM1116487.1 N-acetylmuramoyl-L-alanine amidase [Pseudoflavonifractor sp.]